jgi:hypothetical protein
MKAKFRTGTHDSPMGSNFPEYVAAFERLKLTEVLD